MRLFFATAITSFAVTGALSSSSRLNKTTTKQSDAQDDHWSNNTNEHHDSSTATIMNLLSLMKNSNANHQHQYQNHHQTAFCAESSSSSSPPPHSADNPKKETMSDAISMSLNFSEHRKKKKEERKKEEAKAEKSKQQQEQEQEAESSSSSSSNQQPGRQQQGNVLRKDADKNPVKLVIVGGGYAGSELAYKLDSVFDVTLIDEKNFVENRMEMIKVLCSPWDSTHTNPAQRSQQLAAASHFIHRVYLRRANIVTGKVDFVQFDPPSGRNKSQGSNSSRRKQISKKVSEYEGGSSNSGGLVSSLFSGGKNNSSDSEEKKFVRLKDGRKVPFDLIVFATGEEHSFPFTTKQRTSDQRLAEVKHFCDYLARCHKVAVVGGGPLGCSVAGYLAAGRPDMTVDLYNKHPQLLSRLPKNMRSITEETLSSYTNLNIHHSSTVEDVSSHIIDTRSDWDKLFGVKDVTNDLDKAIDLTAPKEEEAGEKNGGDKKKQLLDKTATLDNTASSTTTTIVSSTKETDASSSNNLIDISFDLQVRKYPAPEKKKNPSIFVRCWMGDEFRGEMPALDPNEKSRLAAERLKKSTLTKEKGYDYVFVCTGGVPRSDLFHNSPELRGHVDARGHIRVSKYFQLYGYPEAFALGRACALPFVRSVGNSNLMANTMFRAMMSRFGEGASSNQVMSKMSQDAHCIVPQRFSIARITIPLGPDENQVVACGAWYGPTGGENAVKEKKAELNLFREFKAPKFFKAQSTQKVRERYEKWSETCSTNVVDFTYTSEIL